MHATSLGWTLKIARGRIPDNLSRPQEPGSLMQFQHPDPKGCTRSLDSDSEGPDGLVKRDTCTCLQCWHGAHDRDRGQRETAGNILSIRRGQRGICVLSVGT